MMWHIAVSSAVHMLNKEKKMNKPHKHAEQIKAWADGVEIEERYPGGVMHVGYHSVIDSWAPFNGQWRDDREYRIKPEPPKYPQTKMTAGELKRAFHAANGETEKGWRGIANAAVARAIEDGQVVPAEMLEEVAERIVNRTWDTMGCRLFAGDVQSIITAVKEGKE